MFINKFLQLILLSSLTKAQVTDSDSKDSLAESRKRITEWEYPIAPRDESATDIYWGKTIQDPYRPLQKSLDPKTLKFIEDSNKYTNQVLQLDVTRENVRSDLQAMFAYERTAFTTNVNGTIYELYTPGTYTQGIITRQVGNGPRETIVDPRNLFEKDTTKIATFKVSKNGKYLVYAINRKGSDWQSLYVVDLATGKQTSDEVIWSKFNNVIDWAADNSGFYYYKYVAPQGFSWDQAGLENDKSVYSGLYFHRLGTNQSQDTQVQQGSADAKSATRSVYTINDRFILTITEPLAPQDGGNGGAQASLIDLNANSRSAGRDFALSGNGNNFIKFLGSDSEGMEFITDIGASNRHVVKVKFDSIDKFEVVAPEVNEKLLYESITNTSKRVNLYYWDGISYVTYTEKQGDNPTEINIPFGNATTAFFSQDGSKFTFRLRSFLHVYQEYEFDFGSKKLSLKRTVDGPGFNANGYEQYLTYYKAKDGTSIPILLAHKKGIRADKSRASLLYGYGGFNIGQSPGYRPAWAYLLEKKDFVIAVALIRGGGERGDSWWKSAVKLNKPLSYSDFSDAVDFLHKDSKYGFVGANKQFINGGSNGGLLTAATCNLIPERLGGCIADVGVHDLLRYKDYTVGSGWYYDYGFPQDSQAQFDIHLKISPLENVLPPTNSTKSKFYPPYLINTSDYDDRVSPVHSLKLAATIQNNHRKSPNPALLYVAHHSGHSASNLPKNIDGSVNLISLINISLGKYHLY